jgi:hypothetical protein
VISSALSAYTRATNRVAAEYLAGAEVGLAVSGLCVREFLHSPAALPGGGSRPPWGWMLASLPKCSRSRAGGAAWGGASRPPPNDDLPFGRVLLPDTGERQEQGVAPIDDGRDLAGFDERLQNRQVLSVVPHDEHAHPLAHKRR